MVSARIKRNQRRVASYIGAGIIGGGGNLAKLKAARAAVLAGTRFGRVLCVGDSTTAANGALTNATLDGAFPLSYPADMAANLTANGLPARSCSMGDGNAASLAGYAAYDTRNSFGGGIGWAIQAAASIGAGLIRAGSTRSMDKELSRYVGYHRNRLHQHCSRQLLSFH